MAKTLTQPEVAERVALHTKLRIVMALENNRYPQDPRVRKEAETLAADGHDVLVLAPRGAKQPRVETVNGVRVKRYRLPTASSALGLVLEYLVYGLQLTSLLAAELLRGAEAVHLHNPPDTLFGVGALARAMGRIVIFDHHDLAPELFEQKYGQGAAGAVLLRWCERMTMRVASVVVSANESHRRVALERGRVDPARIVVVRNAPPAHTLAAESSERAGVLADPRLCYVGSLSSQDGVRILPEILSRLGAGGLRPTLSLVGDGPELPTIKRLAQEHGVLEQIDFMGWVRYDRVPRILEEADICLDVAPCTPLNHRSTMIKIGEYMAAGKPIVTFPLEETRHTAADCALYAACDDVDDYCAVIASLCANERLRARLGPSALERAQGMTWERSAERLRAAYAMASAPAPRARAGISSGLG
jgi:glycosyltransferase involved in cell wall biosynthesis